MYLFNIIINVIIEITIFLFYCSSVFETKKSMSKIGMVISVLILIGSFILLGIFALTTAINLAISFCLCFCFVFFVYEGSPTTKLFICAIHTVSIIIADILATTIITLFGIEYSYSTSNAYSVTYIVGAMLSDFIRLWILAYVGKVLSRRIHKLSIAYWIFLFICPVLSIMCIVIFDIYLMQARQINSFLIFIPPLCILYINFMLFRFFETLAKQIKLKLIEELAQKGEENYKLLQNNETELRKLRHDMQNHIMMLEEYLKNENLEIALQHLNNMHDTLEEIASVVYTSNPAIDAAVNIGAKKAKAANIDYKVQVIGKANVKIESVDICKFLSNAIDNALEACAFCENKYVYVELNITDKKVRLHIENTLTEKPNSIFLTSKADKKNHGFGMKNMQGVVDKYNGYMEYNINNEIFYLDAILYNVLPLKGAV